MNKQLTHLQRRTNNLEDKFSALTNLADQVTELLKVMTNDESPKLFVKIDDDGDFVCELDEEAVTLFNPLDVLTLANWLDATIQSDDPRVHEALHEAEQEN